MCLIIAGPAQKVRISLLTTPGLLKDIWESNGDGIGAMHVSDDGVLQVNKILANTLDDAASFIQRLPESDKDLALHFRMRTHGDIDVTNCHPYPVIDGQVHMMHNGVLQVDDSSDKTKSDTWHYIDQTLRPQIEVAPQIVAVPAWQELVADHIGNSNRLVFLDRSGKLVIVNRRLGIEHDGMWFSNEYAWSPELLIPGYYGKWSGWGRYDDENGQYGAWWKQHNYPTSTSTKYQPLVDPEEVWSVVNDADADEIYKMLDEYPMSTLTVLFAQDRFVCSVTLDELSTQDAKVVGMLEAADITGLSRYCRKSAGRCRKVAEVIAWYGYWHGKAEVLETQPELEVIDGEVVRVDSTPETPDDADLESWREGFQDWLTKQGMASSATKQPAKWTAQTPALFLPPAQVAKVKPIKTINYRGYRVEVPPELLEAGNVVELRDHLEKEAQRMHDEALAAQKTIPVEDLAQTFPPQAAEAASDLVENDMKDRAHVDETNESYAG